MMTMSQEERLMRALPDFVIYRKARYVGDTVEVTCGRYDEVKTLRKGRAYTGEFIVFPQSVICNVLVNAYLQTKPELWEFLEDDEDEDY